MTVKAMPHGSEKSPEPLKAMPHGSEKSPEKNRNEIRHSLCMPHGSAKSWQIMKKMKQKKPQYG